MLDLGQAALDIVGIVDPTPISDGLNGLISAKRGDVTGAMISAVSMVPVIGDVAKAGKFARYAKTLANAVDLAKVDATFAKAARPVVARIRDALDLVPIKSLPKAVQGPLEGLKRGADDFLRRQPGVGSAGPAPAPPSGPAPAPPSGPGKNRGPEDRKKSGPVPADATNYRRTQGNQKLGGPLWSDGNIGKYVNAKSHYLAHGREFGATSAADYVVKAHTFLHNSPPGTLSRARSNGEIVKYDPRTNTFGVLAADGAPRTFFKPMPRSSTNPNGYDPKLYSSPLEYFHRSY
jgi:hypothetical protein